MGLRHPRRTSRRQLDGKRSRARETRSLRRRPRREPFPARVARSARARLRRFRRASALAIATTGVLLLLFGLADDRAPLLSPIADPVAAAALTTPLPQDTTDPAAAVEEATGTLRQLAERFYAVLPKILIALALLAVAALLSAGARAVLRRLLGSWERADAFSALTTVGIWLLAFGAALSVLAGDARALVGSVGLFGLALSWALQAPIESFTGWLLNSFRGYYRVGDRIEVGDVFGDVARIDVLNTTVWEAGGPEKPVQAAQPTGALVTFPNSEVLRASVVNYTRVFPYVWDEVAVGVANETDLGYAMRVFEDVASHVLGDAMREPADRYRRLLARAHLDHEIAAEPKVYAAPTEAYTNLIVRYLVPARERRVWATRMIVALSEALARPEHQGRIAAGYPRTQVNVVASTDGNPAASPGGAGQVPSRYTGQHGS